MSTNTQSLPVEGSTVSSSSKLEACPPQAHHHLDLASSESSAATPLSPPFRREETNVPHPTQSNLHQSGGEAGAQIGGSGGGVRESHRVAMHQKSEGLCSSSSLRATSPIVPNPILPSTSSTSSIPLFTGRERTLSSCNVVAGTPRPASGGNTTNRQGFQLSVFTVDVSRVDFSTLILNNTPSFRTLSITNVLRTHSIVIDLLTTVSCVSFQLRNENAYTFLEKENAREKPQSAQQRANESERAKGDEPNVGTPTNTRDHPYHTADSSNIESDSCLDFHYNPMFDSVGTVSRVSIPPETTIRLIVLFKPDPSALRMTADSQVIVNGLVKLSASVENGLTEEEVLSLMSASGPLGSDEKALPASQNDKNESSSSAGIHHNNNSINTTAQIATPSTPNSPLSDSTFPRNTSFPFPSRSASSAGTSVSAIVSSQTRKKEEMDTSESAHKGAAFSFQDSGSTMPACVSPSSTLAPSATPSTYVPNSAVTSRTAVAQNTIVQAETIPLTCRVVESVMHIHPCELSFVLGDRNMASREITVVNKSKVELTFVARARKIGHPSLKIDIQSLDAPDVSCIGKRISLQPLESRRFIFNVVTVGAPFGDHQLDVQFDNLKDVRNQIIVSSSICVTSVKTVELVSVDIPRIDFGDLYYGHSRRCEIVLTNVYSRRRPVCVRLRQPPLRISHGKIEMFRSDSACQRPIAGSNPATHGNAKDAHRSAFLHSPDDDIIIPPEGEVRVVVEYTPGDYGDDGEEPLTRHLGSEAQRIIEEGNTTAALSAAVKFYCDVFVAEVTKHGSERERDRAGQRGSEVSERASAVSTRGKAVTDGNSGVGRAGTIGSPGSAGGSGSEGNNGGGDAQVTTQSFPLWCMANLHQSVIHVPNRVVSYGDVCVSKFKISSFLVENLSALEGRVAVTFHSKILSVENDSGVEEVLHGQSPWSHYADGHFSSHRGVGGATAGGIGPSSSALSSSTSTLGTVTTIIKIPPLSKINVKVRLTPQRVNPEYRKQLIVKNLNAPKESDIFINVEANNMAPEETKIHDAQYSIERLTPVEHPRIISRVPYVVPFLVKSRNASEPVYLSLRCTSLEIFVMGIRRPRARWGGGGGGDRRSLSLSGEADDDGEEGEEGEDEEEPSAAIGDDESDAGGEGTDTPRQHNPPPQQGVEAHGGRGSSPLPTTSPPFGRSAGGGEGAALSLSSTIGGGAGAAVKAPSPPGIGTDGVGVPLKDVNTTPVTPRKERSNLKNGAPQNTFYYPPTADNDDAIRIFESDAKLVRAMSEFAAGGMARIMGLGKIPVASTTRRGSGGNSIGGSGALSSSINVGESASSRATDAGKATKRGDYEWYDENSGGHDEDTLTLPPGVTLGNMSALRLSVSDFIAQRLEPVEEIALTPLQSRVLYVVFNRTLSCPSWASKEDCISVTMRGTENPRIIRLSYRLCESKFDIGQKSRSFGDVDLGDRKNMRISVRNLCEAPLWFSVEKSTSVGNLRIDNVALRGGGAHYDFVKGSAVKDLDLLIGFGLRGAFRETLTFTNLLDHTNTMQLHLKADVKKVEQFEVNPDNIIMEVTLPTPFTAKNAIVSSFSSPATVQEAEVVLSTSTIVTQAEEIGSSVAIATTVTATSATSATSTSAPAVVPSTIGGESTGSMPPSPTSSSYPSVVKCACKVTVTNTSKARRDIRVKLAHPLEQLLNFFDEELVMRHIQQAMASSPSGSASDPNFSAPGAGDGGPPDKNATAGETPLGLRSVSSMYPFAQFSPADPLGGFGATPTPRPMALPASTREQPQPHQQLRVGSNAFFINLSSVEMSLEVDESGQRGTATKSIEERIEALQQKLKIAQRKGKLEKIAIVTKNIEKLKAALTGASIPADDGGDDLVSEDEQGGDNGNGGGAGGAQQQQQQQQRANQFGHRDLVNQFREGVFLPSLAPLEQASMLVIITCRLRTPQQQQSIINSLRSQSQFNQSVLPVFSSASTLVDGGLRAVEGTLYGPPMPSPSREHDGAMITASSIGSRPLLPLAEGAALLYPSWAQTLMSVSRVGSFVFCEVKDAESFKSIPLMITLNGLAAPLPVISSPAGHSLNPTVTSSQVGARIAATTRAHEASEQLQASLDVDGGTMTNSRSGGLGGEVGDGISLADKVASCNASTRGGASPTQPCLLSSEGIAEGLVTRESSAFSLGVGSADLGCLSDGGLAHTDENKQAVTKKASASSFTSGVGMDGTAKGSAHTTNETDVADTRKRAPPLERSSVASADASLAATEGLVGKGSPVKTESPTKSDSAGDTSKRDAATPVPLIDGTSAKATPVPPLPSTCALPPLPRYAPFLQIAPDSYEGLSSFFGIPTIVIHNSVVNETIFHKLYLTSVNIDSMCMFISPAQRCGGDTPNIVNAKIRCDPPSFRVGTGYVITGFEGSLGERDARGEDAGDGVPIIVSVGEYYNDHDPSEIANATGNAIFYSPKQETLPFGAPTPIILEITPKTVGPQRYFLRFKNANNAADTLQIAVELNPLPSTSLVVDFPDNAVGVLDFGVIPTPVFAASVFPSQPQLPFTSSSNSGSLTSPSTASQPQYPLSSPTSALPVGGPGSGVGAGTLATKTFILRNTSPSPQNIAIYSNIPTQLLLALDAGFTRRVMGQVMRIDGKGALRIYCRFVPTSDGPFVTSVTRQVVGGVTIEAIEVGEVLGYSTPQSALTTAGPGAKDKPSLADGGDPSSRELTVSPEGLVHREDAQRARPLPIVSATIVQSIVIKAKATVGRCLLSVDKDKQTIDLGVVHKGALLFYLYIYNSSDSLPLTFRIDLSGDRAGSDRGLSAAGANSVAPISTSSLPTCLSLEPAGTTLTQTISGGQQNGKKITLLLRPRQAGPIREFLTLHNLTASQPPIRIPIVGFRDDGTLTADLEVVTLPVAPVHFSSSVDGGVTVGNATCGHGSWAMISPVTASFLLSNNTVRELALVCRVNLPIQITSSAASAQKIDSSNNRKGSAPPSTPASVILAKRRAAALSKIEVSPSAVAGGDSTQTQQPSTDSSNMKDSVFSGASVPVSGGYVRLEANEQRFIRCELFDSPVFTPQEVRTLQSHGVVTRVGFIDIELAAVVGNAPSAPLSPKIVSVVKVVSSFAMSDGVVETPKIDIGRFGSTQSSRTRVTFRIRNISSYLPLSLSAIQSRLIRISEKSISVPAGGVGEVEGTINLSQCTQGPFADTIYFTNTYNPENDLSASVVGKFYASLWKISFNNRELKFVNEARESITLPQMNINVADPRHDTLLSEARVGFGSWEGDVSSRMIVTPNPIIERLLRPLVLSSDASPLREDRLDFPDASTVHSLRLRCVVPPQCPPDWVYLLSAAFFGKRIKFNVTPQDIDAELAELMKIKMSPSQPLWLGNLHVTDPIGQPDDIPIYIAMAPLQTFTVEGSLILLNDAKPSSLTQGTAAANGPEGAVVAGASDANVAANETKSRKNTVAAWSGGVGEGVSSLTLTHVNVTDRSTDFEAKIILTNIAHAYNEPQGSAHGCRLSVTTIISESARPFITSVCDNSRPAPILLGESTVVVVNITVLRGKESDVEKSVAIIIVDESAPCSLHVLRLVVPNENLPGVVLGGKSRTDGKEPEPSATVGSVGDDINLTPRRMTKSLSSLVIEDCMPVPGEDEFTLVLTDSAQRMANVSTHHARAQGASKPPLSREGSILSSGAAGHAAFLSFKVLNRRKFSPIDFSVSILSCYPQPWLSLESQHADGAVNTLEPLEKTTVTLIASTAEVGSFEAQLIVSNLSEASEIYFVRVVFEVYAASLGAGSALGAGGQLYSVMCPSRGGGKMQSTGPNGIVPLNLRTFVAPFVIESKYFEIHSMSPNPLEFQIIAPKTYRVRPERLHDTIVPRLTLGDRTSTSISHLTIEPKGKAVIGLVLAIDKVIAEVEPGARVEVELDVIVRCKVLRDSQSTVRVSFRVTPQSFEVAPTSLAFDRFCGDSKKTVHLVNKLSRSGDYCIAINSRLFSVLTGSDHFSVPGSGTSEISFYLKNSATEVRVSAAQLGYLLQSHGLLPSFAQLTGSSTAAPGTADALSVVSPPSPSTFLNGITINSIPSDVLFGLSAAAMNALHATTPPSSGTSISSRSHEGPQSQQYGYHSAFSPSASSSPASSSSHVHGVVKVSVEERAFIYLRSDPRERHMIRLVFELEIDLRERGGWESVAFTTPQSDGLTHSAEQTTTNTMALQTPFGGGGGGVSFAQQQYHSARLGVVGSCILFSPEHLQRRTKEFIRNVVKAFAIDEKLLIEAIEKLVDDDEWLLSHLPPTKMHVASSSTPLNATVSGALMKETGSQINEGVATNAESGVNSAAPISAPVAAVNPSSSSSHVTAFWFIREEQLMFALCHLVDDLLYILHHKELKASVAQLSSQQNSFVPHGIRQNVRGGDVGGGGGPVGTAAASAPAGSSLGGLGPNGTAALLRSCLTVAQMLNAAVMENRVMRTFVERKLWDCPKMPAPILKHFAICSEKLREAIVHCERNLHFASFLSSSSAAASVPASAPQSHIHKVDKGRSEGHIVSSTQYLPPQGGPAVSGPSWTVGGGLSGEALLPPTSVSNTSFAGRPMHSIDSASGATENLSHPPRQPHPPQSQQLVVPSSPLVSAPVVTGGQHTNWQ